MKSPFSPWSPYIVMIAACIGLAVHVAVERQGFPLPVKRDMATTPGVVRSLRDEPDDGEVKTHATVQLFDGSVVEGDVAHGCLVFVGDRVMVTDAGSFLAPAPRLVFPEMTH